MRSRAQPRPAKIARTSKCVALGFFFFIYVCFGVFLHSQLSSVVVVRVVLHCAKLNVRVARSEENKNI